MKIKNSKHQKLINTLEERVLKKHSQANIQENVEYRISEIDLLCTFSIKIGKEAQNIAYVFEMKSNDSQSNSRKAFRQLKRHKEKYFKKKFLDSNRTYFFYVGGLSNGYNIKKVF